MPSLLLLVILAIGSAIGLMLSDAASARCAVRVLAKPRLRSADLELMLAAAVLFGMFGLLLVMCLVTIVAVCAG